LYGTKAKYINYRDDYHSLNYKKGDYNVMKIIVNKSNIDSILLKDRCDSYKNIEVIDVLKNEKIYQK
jgi:hypothetical protein